MSDPKDPGPDLKGIEPSTNKDDNEGKTSKINKRVNWTPDTIVLGPGGIKGFSHLGALFFLDTHGILSEVKNFIGVSVGSIIALLYICGFGVREIITIAADTDLFKDLTSINFNSTKTNKGLMSNGPIKNKIQALLIDKIGFVPSMKQLYEKSGLNYITVTFNVTKDQTEYLSYDTTPHMSVLDATMLSMNIPFLFYKIEYENNEYIDGAFGNPYPVDYLDDGKHNILGIYIESKVSGEDLAGYINKIAYTPLRQLRKTIMAKTSNKCKHLKITTDIESTVGLNVSAEDKGKMVLAGYNEAKIFIPNICQSF